MNNTPHINLNQPQYADPADIMRINESMDIIDTWAKQTDGRINDSDTNLINHNTNAISHPYLLSELANRVRIHTDTAYPTTEVTNFNSLPFGYCRANEERGVMQNSPLPGLFNGEVLTINDKIGLITQKATASNGMDVYRRTKSGEIWFNWVTESTRTTPTKNALPLASGYSAQSANYYAVTQENIVHVIMNIVSSADIVNGAQIVTLPIGFWPAGGNLVVPCLVGLADGGITGTGQLLISASSGAISVWPTITARRIAANFSFIRES